MRRANRRDENQALIVAALEAVGASVLDLSRVGDGCPDLLVGFRGVNWLIEVKIAKGKLRASQETFRAIWRGQKAIARTPLEAVEAIGAV